MLKCGTPSRGPLPTLRNTLLLIRHGEIGLKSHAVRNRFENALSQRLEQALVRREVEAIVTRAPARHYVETDDLEGAADAVRHVFGITTFSPAVRVDASLDTLVSAAADYAKTWWPEGAESFAIRPRRTGTHPFTSQELGKEAGSGVYVAMRREGVPVRVDLDKPDFALTIEVRGKDAYLHHQKYPGPGGLPLGTQGRMVVHLDSADAAAAAYLMMRRGAQVYPFYLPQVVGNVARPDQPADHPAKRIHEALLEWDAPKDLRPWRIDDALIEAATGDPLPEDGVLLQRLALEAAAAFATRVRAQAVVTGETRRSPWAARLPETHVDSGLPVLRPLMGLTRPVIDDFRELLGFPRLGGPRLNEDERAYTAGGRGDTEQDAESRPKKDVEVGPWDPY